MDEHKLIYGLSTEATKQVKEVKMNLPIQQLVRLHGIKILTGTTISETVTKALDSYFAAMESAHDADAAPVVEETTEAS